VTSGWRGNYEANEVIYDPNQVDVPAMEERLRRAGTYLKTLEPGSP
jgi:hypothetical protein